jgi:hypothetical protein
LKFPRFPFQGNWRVKLRDICLLKLQMPGVSQGGAIVLWHPHRPHPLCPPVFASTNAIVPYRLLSNWESCEVFPIDKEWEKSDTRHIKLQRCGALSIKRLEGGRCRLRRRWETMDYEKVECVSPLSTFSSLDWMVALW